MQKSTKGLSGSLAFPLDRWTTPLPGCTGQEAYPLPSGSPRATGKLNITEELPRMQEEDLQRWGHMEQGAHRPGRICTWNRESITQAGSAPRSRPYAEK